VDLLAGLDERQHAAVTAGVGAPLAILAPAGSGKTRVLTRRIAWLAHDRAINARHTLAVTFTRKAAGELVDRLGALDAGDVTAGTFHALCLAQLRRRQADRGRELPALLERKARILAPLVGGRGDAQIAAINEVAGEIEWAKARSIAPAQFEMAAHTADRQLPRPASELAAIYSRYEAEKQKRRLIDFDDLLWWCADALERDPDFATSIRFRHRHLFVDEFQDVSPAQLRVLRGWLGERADLCVVGDEAQSIFGFAGAESSVLVNFAHHFPGGQTIRLATNYRSSPEIVAAADAILGVAAGVVRPTPRTVRERGAAPTVREFENDAAEARGVALTARHVHDRGIAWRDIAVLYRTNAQSAAFEAAFGAMGIPFRLPGVGAFLARPEVKAAIAELKKVDRASPGRPLADHLADLAAGDVEPPAATDGPEATDTRETEETAAAPSTERRAHTDALVRFGNEYLAAEGGTGSLAGFIAWLSATTRGEGDPSDAARDAVEFVSYHRAKGLEWNVVFVTGVEQGLVPISYARTSEAKAEELRLLHVALSRAIDELHVSWAAERVVAGRVRTRRPSQWLATITQVAGGQTPTPLPDPRAGIAAARAALRSSRPDVAPIDRALFEKLRDWRLHTARAADVPAFVVFSDATLNAIAEHRPTTRVSLLEVPGVGPTKLDRYGEAVLDLVQQHCEV
jgi:DNA helicase-2/ATP-dependent DNA helicase PcrA